MDLSSPVTAKVEATALVETEIMYTVQAPNDVVALDAATGRIFWTYSYHPGRARPCCGGQPRTGHTRRHTLHGNDRRTFGRDRCKNGRAALEHHDGESEVWLCHNACPAVLKDKVIIGTAGGEYGIAALSPPTMPHWAGSLALQYIPGPGEPGHETWRVTPGNRRRPGVDDRLLRPELNLTYWGVGNPSPDWNGDVRPGDNLFSDSVVALDADTGKLKCTTNSHLTTILTLIPYKSSLGRHRVAGRSVWSSCGPTGTASFMCWIARRPVPAWKSFVEVTWASGFDERADQ